MQANFKQSVTIINVSFKDEVLMGQLTRSVSVTSGHSATYTVYGVEITEREDDRLYRMDGCTNVHSGNGAYQGIQEVYEVL